MSKKLKELEKQLLQEYDDIYPNTNNYQDQQIPDPHTAYDVYGQEIKLNDWQKRISDIVSRKCAECKFQLIDNDTVVVEFKDILTCFVKNIGGLYSYWCEFDREVEQSNKEFYNSIQNKHVSVVENKLDLETLLSSLEKLFKSLTNKVNETY